MALEFLTRTIPSWFGLEPSPTLENNPPRNETTDPNIYKNKNTISLAQAGMDAFKTELPSKAPKRLDFSVPILFSSLAVIAAPLLALMTYGGCNKDERPPPLGRWYPSDGGKGKKDGEADGGAVDGSPDAGEPEASPTNHPPQFGPMSDQVIDEGELLEFTLPVFDPDGDPLQVSASNLPENAKIEEIPNGQGFFKFSWTPQTGQAGEYNINFEVSDGQEAAKTTMKVTVLVIDRDGDGFKTDVDCDDDDPSAFPLNNNQKYSITKSVTICPGKYSNVQLSIPPGTSGIMIVGTDVELDGSGFLDDAIAIDDSQAISLQDFKIVNYNGDQAHGIRVWNTPLTFIKGLEILNGSGGIHMVDCPYSRILDVNTVGSRGIHVFSSDHSIIENCNISSGVLQGWGGEGLIIKNNKVENNIGSGILIDGTDFFIGGNIVRNNSDHGIELLYSNNSVIQENKVNNNGFDQNPLFNNGYGIYIFDSHDNGIYSNDLTGNFNGSVLEDSSSSNNEFVGNIPPP